MLHITWTDMGLGKTFVGSEKMKQFNNRVNLIVCQKSKIEDWCEHIKQNYGCAFVPYSTTKKVFVAWDLTDKKDFENFFEAIKSELKVYHVGIINYDLLWRRPELLKLDDFTLMLDESSLIQNRTSKRTKFILKMKPSHVILLSGTPISGKIEALWTQCHLLGWDISNKTFQSMFVNWTRCVNHRTGQVFKVVDPKEPYKNVDRLKAKLKEHGSVFMKTSEVMDLPEQTFIPVKVDASKEYRRFKENKLLELPDRELIGDTSLTFRLGLRMLCGIYSEAKLNAFSDLLESTDDRLIVFYNFNDEIEKLKTVCDLHNRPYSIINGSVKDLSSYETESNSVVLVQYQAGAMGLNLQKANKIIYYSPTDRCELWMQSQKRIHRIGQKKPCFYYTMTVKGSVEERIYKALERGEDYTDELFRKEMQNEKEFYCRY